MLISLHKDSTSKMAHKPIMTLDSQHETNLLFHRDPWNFHKAGCKPMSACNQFYFFDEKHHIQRRCVLTCCQKQPGNNNSQRQWNNTVELLATSNWVSPPYQEQKHEKLGSPAVPPYCGESLEPEGDVPLPSKTRAMDKPVLHINSGKFFKVWLAKLAQGLGHCSKGLHETMPKSSPAV